MLRPSGEQVWRFIFGQNTLSAMIRFFRFQADRYDPYGGTSESCVPKSEFTSGIRSKALRMVIKIKVSPLESCANGNCELITHS